MAETLFTLFAPAQDLRNHGKSPHNERHDYTSMAEDVERFIQDHELSGSALIGHSMYDDIKLPSSPMASFTRT